MLPSLESISDLSQRRFSKVSYLLYTCTSCYHPRNHYPSGGFQGSDIGNLPQSSCCVLSPGRIYLCFLQSLISLSRSSFLIKVISLKRVGSYLMKHGFVSWKKKIEMIKNLITNTNETIQLMYISMI